MRNYRRNSPQAAGRIVALALMADGHVCRTELDALARADAEQRLGLAPGSVTVLLHTLCEDLLASSAGAMPLGVDRDTLASILDEVDDPVLQRELLDILETVAAADDHAADGESLVVESARARWVRASATKDAPLAA